MPLETNESRRGTALMSETAPLGWHPAKIPIEWSGWPLSESARSLSSPVITISLIGGHRLLRDATARLLAVQDGLDVLGNFESVADFLDGYVGAPPGVLLLDCDGGGPGDCQKAVEALSARVKSGIVMLCREPCEEVVRCAIEYRVSGVILKSFSTEDVMAAIQYMATGRTVMPAGWQRAVAVPRDQQLKLSPRHRQILALIAQGRRNGEIASELELSPNTIKFHIQALYLRLEVRNRVEAANQYAQIVGGGD